MLQRLPLPNLVLTCVQVCLRWRKLQSGLAYSPPLEWHIIHRCVTSMACSPLQAWHIIHRCVSSMACSPQSARHIIHKWATRLACSPQSARHMVNECTPASDFYEVVKHCSGHYPAACMREPLHV